LEGEDGDEYTRGNEWIERGGKGRWEGGKGRRLGRESGWGSKGGSGGVEGGGIGGEKWARDEGGGLGEA